MSWAVELFNGLEIGDPQISKYVPEFLGRMILKLPPQEFDEFINTISSQILTVNIQLGVVYRQHRRRHFGKLLRICRGVRRRRGR